MIPEYFAIIGAAIGSLGGFYYLYETAVGKAKPNRVTWLLWGLFPMIIFLAQRVQGVEDLSWATFAAGFTPLLIVLASFINKKAYWKTEPKDYYLMAAAIVGINLWAITKEPNLAIIFSLAADIFAHHTELDQFDAILLTGGLPYLPPVFLISAIVLFIKS